MSVKPVGGSTQIWLPEAVIPRKTLHRFVTTDLHDGPSRLAKTIMLALAEQSLDFTVETIYNKCAGNTSI